MKKIFTSVFYNPLPTITRLFLFIGLLAFATNTSAAIRYVKVTPTGTGNGNDWNNASGNFQAMIDASVKGDEVWVAKGTYQPVTSFSMIEGVKIYGGFEGNEASLTLRDLTKTANTSTLKGNNDNPVVITLYAKQITNAALDGFVITGGSGGVRCLNSSITVRNCSITSNIGIGYGGVFTAGSNSSLVLINCSITNNSCSFSGGGGGVKNDAFAATTLINCTISGNTATGGGTGGIANDAGQSLKLRNCILYGNSGGIVSNDMPDIRNSLIQGLTSTDNGNISGDLDPLFVDAENGNYRLQLCSPVINKGSNTYYASNQTPDLSAITTDLAGKPRFYNNGIVDMGAYELEYSTAIIYVKQNGTGPGTSWDCPTGDLQAAINASESGQEVWVAGGTYQRTSAPGYFSMKEGVKIYGGFAGNETSLIERDLTKTFNTSTLLGGGASVVRNDNALTTAALLDGFTITGGGSSGVFNSSASPTFRNCIITGNSSIYLLGGGMYNESSSPVLINCIIRGNTIGWGWGGGMFNVDSSPVLINCTITGNTADEGGGMYNAYSSPKLYNTIIYGNNSGIYNSGSSPDIHNSLIQGITSTTSGNISGDTDPLFVDPANSDYRLQPCSPVINKGSNTYYEVGQTPDLSSITTDMDGEARFYGNGTVDMGAYEFHQFTTLPVAGVTYVKAGSTGTGTSWDCPTGDLQAAINASESGQEVWVAGGIYKRANVGEYFAMKKGVKIYGGFAGDEEILTQRNLKTTHNVSILQGNGAAVIKNDFNNFLTAATILDGFTITGGEDSGIQNLDCSPSIINCLITGNTANEGGGIYNAYSSSPTLINCIITNNTANAGGGIYNYADCSTMFTNCIIADNIATDGIGAGIFNSTSDPWLTNCSIINNEGSAIHDKYASYTRLRNCILYGNSSGIFNTNFTPEIYNSLVQGLSTSDDGNIPGNTDPLFVDPTHGDYRLHPCSPAINKGSNTYYGSGQYPDLRAITTDLAGEARFYANGTVDMGAYEYAGSPSTPILAGNNAEFTQTISGNTLIGVNGSACTVIASVAPNGGAPLAGDVTAKVWVEATQPTNFVKRHYQLTPTATGSETATAKVTLYFTQQEFDDFNAVNSVKLPINSADMENYKTNLRIEKRTGSSNDNSGLPGSYDGTILTFNPLDPAVNGSITWNTWASRWEVSFDVTGFSGFFAKTTEAALPLNLISFTGTKENGVNLLNWKTTNEVNTLNFEVQSSADAKTFNKLTTVPANGSGNHEYSYQDATPYFGNTYYRLKMVDRDGSFAYSKIISIMNNELSKATVHPNPAVEPIILTISPTLLQSTATLYDLTGRPLQKITLTTNKQQVDVKSLSSGVYILKFADGTAERFVKE